MSQSLAERYDERIAGVLSCYACPAKSSGQYRRYPPRDLLPDLRVFSPTRLSRQLRRLLDIGVIKRVAGTYRYYLTKAGRAATAAAQQLKHATIVPAMI
jgi:DNA-binding HxlR family transcriptional regulator